MLNHKYPESLFGAIQMYVCHRNTVDFLTVFCYRCGHGRQRNVLIGISSLNVKSQRSTARRLHRSFADHRSLRTASTAVADLLLFCAFIQYLGNLKKTRMPIEKSSLKQLDVFVKIDNSKMFHFVFLHRSEWNKLWKNWNAYIFQPEYVIWLFLKAHHNTGCIELFRNFHLLLDCVGDGFAWKSVPLLCMKKTTYWQLRKHEHIYQDMSKIADNNQKTICKISKPQWNLPSKRNASGLPFPCLCSSCWLQPQSKYERHRSDH